MLESAPGTDGESGHSVSRTIVLASGSRYRASVLAKLGLPFAQQAAAIDETAGVSEHPYDLVRRLGVAKAAAVAAAHPDALIIGGDQVACVNGSILGKPGGRAQAINQLTVQSAQRVRFFTSLHLLDTATNAGRTLVDVTDVQFRALTQSQIECYVDQEQPYDCAGSFKSEGLGIALFRAIRGTDPDALVGLPLIGLCTLLEQAGQPVLGT